MKKGYKYNIQKFQMQLTELDLKRFAMLEKRYGFRTRAELVRFLMIMAVRNKEK